MPPPLTAMSACSLWIVTVKCMWPPRILWLSCGQGLWLVFVSGGGSPRFNVDWSFIWPLAAVAAAVAAAAVAQRQRWQWHSLYAAVLRSLCVR